MLTTPPPLFLRTPICSNIQPPLSDQKFQAGPSLSTGGWIMNELMIDSTYKWLFKSWLCVSSGHWDGRVKGLAGKISPSQKKYTWRDGLIFPWMLSFVNLSSSKASTNGKKKKKQIKEPEQGFESMNYSISSTYHL